VGGPPAVQKAQEGGGDQDPPQPLSERQRPPHLHGAFVQIVQIEITEIAEIAEIVEMVENFETIEIL
jgi:hypothetical protein